MTGFGKNDRAPKVFSVAMVVLISLALGSSAMAQERLRRLEQLQQQRNSAASDSSPAAPAAAPVPAAVSPATAAPSDLVRGRITHIDPWITGGNEIRHFLLDSDPEHVYWAVYTSNQEAMASLLFRKVGDDIEIVFEASQGEFRKIIELKKTSATTGSVEPSPARCN